MHGLSRYQAILLSFIILIFSFFPIYNTISFHRYPIHAVDYSTYPVIQSSHSTVSKTTIVSQFLSDSSIINCLISISDEFFNLKKPLYTKNDITDKKFLLFYLFTQMIAVMVLIIFTIKVMLKLAYIIYYYIQKLIHSIYQYDGKKKYRSHLILPL